MNQYEVTFIVDPVLSNDEIESTSKSYQDLITNEDCSIVHVNRMGLKQLAYPINRRSSGVYYCVEFNGDKIGVIPKMELALRRDERIMRFLTVKLDRYGIKYNEDKRAGKIGTVKKKEEKKDDSRRGGRNSNKKSAPKPTPAAPAPAKAAPATPAPVKAAPVAAAPVAAAAVAKSEEE